MAYARAAETEQHYDGARAAEASSTPSEDLNQRVGRNVVVVSVSQLLVWAVTSVTIMILPRHLGADALGRFYFVWGVMDLCAVLILFGTPTYLTREVARRPVDAGHITFNTMLMRVPLLLLGASAMIAVAALVGVSGTTRNLLLLAVAAMVFIVMNNAVKGSLQGLHRMSLLSGLGVAEKVFVGVAGLLVVVGMNGDIVAFAGVNVLAVALTSFVAMAYFGKVSGYSMRPDRNMWRVVAIGGLPFLVWQLSMVVYGSIDVILLGFLSSDEVVGWYGTAYRFVGVPAFFSFAITTALLPALSQMSGERANMLARRSMHLVVLVNIPIALFLLVAADLIIHVLHYEPGFDNAIPLLRILSLHIPGVAISMVAGTVLIARNRESAWARAAIGAAVINISLNAMLIPFFEHTTGNGAIGAAIVTVVTEACIVAASLVLVGPGVFGREDLVSAGRCVAAGVPMVLVMLLVRPQGILAVAAAGALAYGFSALVTKAVRPAELRSLPRLILSRESTVASVPEM